MSTPPTKYTRKTNFQAFQASTTNPIRGADLDAEFSALKTTTDQAIDRIALIQRDDGALKNGTVTRDALSTDFLPQLINDVAGGISSDKAVIVAAKDETLAAQADADAARDQAVAAKTAALSSQTAAATSETNAATSATNAAGSASSAAASASNALASKNAAATSETNAATSATSASTSASAASTSASNAAGSASTASTAATNAGNSATAAATSATNASNSATSAATSASQAANSAAAVTSGLRNRIINGDMRIDQRNAGAAITVSPNAAKFVADRMYVVNTTAGAGAFSVQQVPDAPDGFTSSVKVTCTTAQAALGANDFFSFQHRIEGANVADFGFGTAAAKTVTVSFLVKASVAGTYGFSVTNHNGTRSYTTSYTIGSANTWEYKTITLPGDTAGTWLKDTIGYGFNAYFGLGMGSTYVAPTNNAWTTGYYTPSGAENVMSAVGRAWQITGLQVEPGTVATPFERRPYGLELALCQRYYAAGVGFGAQGYASSTTSLSAAKCFGTVMRAVPTISFSGMTYVNASGIGTLSISADGFVASAAGTTAGGNANFFTNWTASAEL